VPFLLSGTYALTYFAAHGHGHHGTYECATLRGTPVYNVAQRVLMDRFGKPYTVLEV